MYNYLHLAVIIGLSSLSDRLLLSACSAQHIYAYDSLSSLPLLLHHQDALSPIQLSFSHCGSHVGAIPILHIAYLLNLLIRWMRGHLWFWTFVLHHFSWGHFCSNTKGWSNYTVHEWCRWQQYTQSTFRMHRHCWWYFIENLCTFHMYLKMKAKIL